MGFPGKGRDNILRKWNFVFSNSAAKKMHNLFEIVEKDSRKCVYKVDWANKDQAYLSSLPHHVDK